MTISKENKASIVKEFRQHSSDVGSCEVQVALLTSRINELTGHVKGNQKDHHSKRGLLALVEKRRKLLHYLGRMDRERYTKLIQKLKLRK